MASELPAQAGRRTLARRMYGLIALSALAMGAILFIPAGTLAYWEAWLYLAVLLIPTFFVLRYLLAHNPQLLARRMQMREQEASQRRIISFASLYFLLVFILPGLDERWGWSGVPTALVLAADLVVVLGYGVFVLVLRENQYAARTIRVEQDQPVISSGPYAVVRHPMYVGVLLMYLATPLALGSYWALLPALLIIPVLVTRIVNEEHVLERDLKGYPEYEQVTRYRLVPRVW